MQRFFFLIGIPLLASFTLSVAVHAQTPPAKNPFAGDAKAIAEGKGIFEGVCAGYCHATETTTRPGSRCPSLFDCEWKHGSDDAAVFKTMQDGVPKTEMIGFKGRLPDDMLWKIIAYMRSASKCKDGGAAAPAPAH
jgi:cytochrome c oxidase cbb3-type subunit III